MRVLHTESVTKAVADMCIRANRYLPEDARKHLVQAHGQETIPAAQEILEQLIDNYQMAADSGLPLCQDTGYAVFFVRIGQDIRLEGPNIRDAINEGVRQGYARGFLRKSTCDPFTRKNYGDNTPAVVHFDVVPGDGLTINFMPKGGGSENMSRVVMLAPSEGWEGIRRFVLLRVAESGANPCPPIVVGLGIGGTFDYAPILAKQALLRPLDDHHPDPDIAQKEASLLEDINKLGIGPMGLGGVTTALAVKIAVGPCHIASLPLAVNIQCHAARHEEVSL